MNKVLGYVLTALVPVLFAWALGYAKLPDSVDLLDYSAAGAELINSKEQLASTLKIEAGSKRVEKLSIYHVRFKNNSSRNLQNVRVEFKIKTAPDGELVASVIKGPQDYSDSLVKKISESRDSATYTIDFINVSNKSSRDYFTASFLFSGDVPESVAPVSLSPGIAFIDAKENNKEDTVFIIIVVFLAIVYGAVVWWVITHGNKEGRVRRAKYEQEVIDYLVTRLSLLHDDAVQRAQELMVLKDAVFKPEWRFKTWLKGWLGI